MDILSRLYRLPTGRFHYTLLGLIGVGWLFDAMDTGLVSFVLPTLSQQWQLTPAQSGWIVSVAFVGMALGAVASGWAADRFGRRNVFVGTMVLYSIATNSRPQSLINRLFSISNFRHFMSLFRSLNSLTNHCPNFSYYLA